MLFTGALLRNRTPNKLTSAQMPAPHVPREPLLMVSVPGSSIGADLYYTLYGVQSSYRSYQLKRQSLIPLGDLGNGSRFRACGRVSFRLHSRSFSLMHTPCQRYRIYWIVHRTGLAGSWLQGRHR